MATSADTDIGMNMNIGSGLRYSKRNGNLRKSGIVIPRFVNQMKEKAKTAVPEKIMIGRVLPLFLICIAAANEKAAMEATKIFS